MWSLNLSIRDLIDDIGWLLELVLGSCLHLSIGNLVDDVILRRQSFLRLVGGVGLG